MRVDLLSDVVKFFYLRIHSHEMVLTVFVKHAADTHVTHNVRFSFWRADKKLRWGYCTVTFFVLLIPSTDHIPHALINFQVIVIRLLLVHFLNFGWGINIAWLVTYIRESRNLARNIIMVFQGVNHLLWLCPFSKNTLRQYLFTAPLLWLT